MNKSGRNIYIYIYNIIKEEQRVFTLQHCVIEHYITNILLYILGFYVHSKTYRIIIYQLLHIFRLEHTATNSCFSFKSNLNMYTCMLISVSVTEMKPKKKETARQVFFKNSSTRTEDTRQYFPK